MRLRSSSSLLAIAILGIALLPSLVRPSSSLADDERLVLAFYYTWYDQKTWTSGKVPDVPLTLYASANRDAMARQVEQARTAGIDAFVLNWWGKGNQTERNLKALLDVAAHQGFRVAVDFDISSPFMGGMGSYVDNLRHLHTVHAAHPAYLHFHGHPVVFFYNVSRLPLFTWQSLRDQVDPGRSALWIAEGTDLKYQSVFDGHHLYSITWPNRISPSQTLPKWGDRIRKYNREHGASKLWIATVMPGYDDRKARPGSGFARSREGGQYYRQCWQAAIASQPHWVIINSFNEWPEGTYIEPSQAHGNLYLDLTREWAGRFKGADFALKPLPSPLPTFTPVPPKSALAPSPPTPTPLPPTYFIENELLDMPETLGPGCGYILSPIGTANFWIVYCGPETVTTKSILMVY